MKQYSFSTSSAFKPICKKLFVLDTTTIHLSIAYKHIKEVKNLETQYTNLTETLVEYYYDNTK